MKFALIVILVLIAYIVTDGCDSHSKKSFDNYKIVSVIFENQSEIKEFENTFAHDPVDVNNYLKLIGLDIRRSFSDKK
jgi:hypothetical protein